jgi:hypothetical protein
MKAFLISVFVAFCFIRAPVSAHEPVIGKTHAVAETGWHWKINGDDLHTIVLSSANGAEARYDIGGCIFCSGEDDNCNKTGIFPIPMPDAEPAIAVVCHKGAHSQRLQVLAPMRDMKKPVFEITGEYWVDVEPRGTGLRVTYDRRAADGTMKTLAAEWPH